MCRWWTVGIWPWLAAHGYTHLFRLDEDSFLLSPLRGDVFRAAAAAEGGFDLGYRMLSFESGVLDDDGDASTACQAPQDCSPGTVVSADSSRPELVLATFDSDELAPLVVPGPSTGEL